MSSTGTKPPPPTDAETRLYYLTRSNRAFAPIRKTFVQAPRGAASRDGPLSVFVHNGDHRALLAYLFILSVISSGDSDDGWSTRLSVGVWVRVLSTARNAEPASARTAVSKTLTRLVDRHLIERERVGKNREVRVRLLREDGSGKPYERPTGRSVKTRFLKLRHEFWTEGWNERLSLPELTMLLVALHEKDGFTLPSERSPEWYGWSADTTERGFQGLEEHGLLKIDPTYETTPYTDSGLTQVNRYTLTDKLKPLPATKK